MNFKFKKLVLIAFFLISSKAIYSQSFTISGILTDQTSGEIIVGAYVICPQTGIGVVSNQYGYYAITIPYGVKNLIFSHENFFIVMDTIQINRNKFINRDLVPKQLDEVDISPLVLADFREPINTETQEENENRLKIKNSAAVNELITRVFERNFKIIDVLETGSFEIPGFQINKMPSLVGEIDVARALKFLPGVAPGTELNNGLFIRGGGQDQNLMQMDGVPLYNTNHLFGFYSVFNSEAIKNIHLSKSGFSARNGGRLSGITDVVMKEGGTDGVHGIYLNSLLATTLDIHGPLTKDKRTTFMFSGRRSFWDLFAMPFNDNTNSLAFNFYDINFKLSHRINTKNKLIFSVYNGRDKYATKNTEETDSFKRTNVFDIRWGNLLASAKWNRIVNEKLFYSTSINYSQYQSSLTLGFENERITDSTNNRAKLDYKYKNFIRDINPKVDFDYLLNKNNTLKFGASFSYKMFLPGATFLNYVSNSTTRNDTVYSTDLYVNSSEIAAYIEDEIQLSNTTKMSAGVRLANYFYKGTSYIMPEPRISFNSRFDNEFAIKASYTLMNQSIHLLADNNNSLFTDRWVPATGQFGPQRAHQFSLGFSQPFTKNIEFTMDAYYKHFSKILDIKEGSNPAGGLLNDGDWQSSVLMGTGRSYGFEAFIHKRKGITNGWIAYTLSWAKRNTPGVNNDQDYYFQFDRRHYINFVMNHQIDERHDLSINVVWSTGNVQSIPTGRYRDINGNLVFDYDQKNNYRLANTLRFDIGFNRIRNQNNWSESGYRFSIYNVLARNNPAYIRFEDNGNGSGIQAVQVGFLGFIPGVTYYTKF